MSCGCAGHSEGAPYRTTTATMTAKEERAGDSMLMTSTPASGTFSHVFGQQCQLMEAAVQSLHTLNDQISHFVVTKSKTLEEDQDPFLPTEKESLKNSMTLMRHLLMDAQAKILSMMEDNKQLALRIDGAIQSASQEVTNLRAELTATNRRLAELSGSSGSGGGGGGGGSSSSSSGGGGGGGSGSCDSSIMENNHHNAQVLLREEVSQLQEEVHLLRQMKEMLTKDLEESHGSKSSEILSATELKVQLAQKEQELARAKEALLAMKADRKRLKAEKTDLVSQMQQLYATLESREEQLRDFIRNYEQHRKESEDAVKALAKEKDLLEREKWELRRQAKEATDHATSLRSQLDLKDNRMKELEAELAMAKQSLATLTKDVPKRHSLAMPGETVLNGNQEWVMQADLPLTAAIRQSQQTLYHSHPPHPADRQAVRVSPCHSRQPSIISDASAAEGDRSSTPSDINSPRHRTHSLCNGDSPGPVQKNLHNPIVQSLEDLEDQKRKKKKEKMGFGSISRVFARGKQRKSLDPGLFDDSDSLSSPTRLSLSEGEEQMDRLQQVELVRTTPMSHWKAGTVQTWLEVVMAMPMYVKACAENVKSGKVLLSLSDEDLETGLGVCSSLHRRKLRLAIEDYRDAETGKCLSKASDLDHHWVAKAWLNDIGLPQYSQAFHNHLIDGRMLNSLMKRDLEKHLNVSKKFHQVSILLGIQLLYQVNFSKEVLQERRARCETQNIDPVVWTNQRVLKWVRDIDLKEYADNLTNSGVHGAVLVLEPTFTAEAMATALGIPSGRHILRRHLAEEMSTIINPASTAGIREAERFGTPPGRSSSITRQGKDSENNSSVKYKTGRLPLGKIGRGFSSKDLDFHDDYGSLRNEDCFDDDSQDRADQCRLENYSGLEVTNV
ncbi:kazrin isoform X1 [Monodelphis domestica]|uniref:kazrin isoform X1 n=1 Tax=Monodelphis domestica TaxID=13616 RepID=UPI0024E21112|nr:kazrin isoform X1 [Monodelphis domestica]